ncbi:MAG: pyridoxal kinase, partial [Hyphomicrobiales bacterium]
MPAILSLSSQVLRGHVGNSAAVPTFNALGFEAWAVPTVILSNHPGHGSAAGCAVAASDMEAMIRELERHGWLQDCVGILTGYFRSPEQCMFASQLVHDLKHTNPEIFYCCDPVIGDDPQGLYVDTDIALAVRDRLAPQADLLTPNLFELQWLSGVHARAPEDVAEAACALNGAEVMATSIPAGDDRLATVWVEGETGVQAVVGRRADVPHGVGDMMAAAALACRLSGDDPARALGRACGLVEHVLDVSQGRDELDLTAGLRDAATVPVVWVRPVGADEHDFAGTGWVAGVDGCPAGWIVALVDADDPGNARCELCRDFTDILMLEPRPEIIAVDIPIGVPDIAIRGGRTCDNETRSRLGGRQSSVF